MRKKQIKISKHILAAFSIITFLFFSISSGDKKSEPSNETTETKEASNSSKPKEVDNWKYSESEDKMDGIKHYFASNISTNEIEFDFPYHGGSTLDIVIRNSKNKNEVILAISKGQFMLSIDGSESVKVKFDDEKSETYSYNSAKDASSDVIFLNNSSKFIKKLKASKKVMIESTFFDAGNKIFEFNVEGLVWDK